jgi:hypothetical protein
LRRTYKDNMNLKTNKDKLLVMEQSFRENEEEDKCKLFKLIINFSDYTKDKN